ncbi:hypothetical protein LSH36_790g01029 [Paralvinella palmiformis]|uniref:CARD domain-containing protein n=1 Tax=Paralvinella palmiformis TaxID=53620 RepID=A0AAD9MU92_9ANNE|nr:hypothetical protein LSH36_790g01029 [Paralvinella palmiformis]
MIGCSGNLGGISKSEKVLISHRADLCRKLAPEKYYPVLRQMAVFNKDDQQEVHSRVTQTDKVSLLLDKLDRLDNPYDVLIEVLKQNKTEKHVIQFLERALRRMLEVEVPKYHGRVISGSPADDDDLQDLPLPS